MRSWIVAIFAVLGGAMSVRAADAPDARGVEFFEKNVRPVLVDKCYQCHSAAAKANKKLKGGLYLDTREATRKGGETGPAIVAGKPDESLLIKAVRYTDSDLKMPPKEKLSDAQVTALEQWVKMGAPDPREALAKGVDTTPKPWERKHWAFEPITRPAVPNVKNARWPVNFVDRFILAELEEKQIAPVAAADRRTLIRRATFDLTGLPPAPAEIEAFLADDSADAFAKVVDRLLASPRYGERWGRHWLDVARYADSNGLDENVCHGNAWRYRDWVIESFNSDKPYDQFITEQIAGDLLQKPAAPSQLIATGFLSLGPKVLAEVDESKMEMDIIDEQIDTLGKSVLGLTLGCARCHDHKFDPIATKDYYALAGIFKSTRTMEHFKKIAKWWENPIPTAEDLAKKAEFERQKQELQGKLKLAESNKDAAEAKKLKAELAKLEKAAPQASSAMGVTEAKVVDVAIHLRGSHLTLGEVVPRRFPLVLAGENQAALPANQSGRLELARFLTSKENPLTARVMANRIWKWHFGEGLVRTPDNFGKLGEAPSNPKLLDALARSFMEGGWSIKAMHRAIMLSRTYQLSGAASAEAARVDPDNRLHWRYSPHRLEAEAIRDAMLAVSGRLELTMGGPAITHVKNREFLFDHTSKDGTTYSTTRRSVYLPVVRNHIYDFFELYDFPDSAVSQGNRPVTTVAPQALLMMNSPLIWEASGKLADEMMAQEPQAALRALFPKLFGRPIESDEIKRFEYFMEASLREAGPKSEERQSARRRAWQMYCQAQLVSNEFIYVR